MATPTRYPQGISVSFPWQFFGGMGLPNPFYYHQRFDDFDILPAATSGWTPTGTGTVTAGSADGGTAILTTTAVAAEFEEIQGTQVSFTPVSGKKLYFVARVSLSDVTNAAFLAGLMPITATPFTNPANGIWISKASGSTQLVLNVANSSVVTSTNIPTASITLANNVAFDVGIHVTAGAATTGVAITATVAPNLVAFTPQSGNGSANSTNRQPNIASTAPLITTLQATVLAPVVAVQAGTTTIKTMSVDFVGAFRER
jgi:hypothetical protein